MKLGDLFVQVFGQGIDLTLIARMSFPQLDLCQHLVGERGAHDKARVARSATQVHQTPLGQHNQTATIGKFYFVHLRLDIVPRVIAQGVNLNLAVKMADVADDGSVLHLAHMVDGDNIPVAGAGNKYVAQRRSFLHSDYLITFHRRL